VISSDTSRISVPMVSADEELMIARAVCRTVTVHGVKRIILEELLSVVE